VGFDGFQSQSQNWERGVCSAAIRIAPESAELRYNPRDAQCLKGAGKK